MPIDRRSTWVLLISTFLAGPGLAQEAPIPPIPPNGSEPAERVPEPKNPWVSPPDPGDQAPESSEPPTGSFPVTEQEGEPAAIPPPPPPPPTPTPAPASMPAEPEAPPASAPSPEAWTLPSAPASSNSMWTHPSGSQPGAPSREQASGGLFGPLRLGPVVGVGLPSLLNFGGMLKVTEYFGAGINFGMIPKVRLDLYGEAALSYQQIDLYGRLHPFGGGFFLGAGVGYTFVRGTVRNTYDISSFTAGIPGLPSSLTTESKGKIQTLVILPQFGYFYTFRSGFSVGLEFGAQVPIAPGEIEFETRVSEEIPQAIRDRYITPNDEKVRETLESIARTPIPTVQLRFGWLL